MTEILKQVQDDKLGEILLRLRLIRMTPVLFPFSRFEKVIVDNRDKEEHDGS